MGCAHTILTAAILVLPAPAFADLAGYVARPEPAAKATVAAEAEEDGLSVTTFELVSQAWRGKPWDHDLRVFRVAGAPAGDVAILAISGSEALARELARRTRLPAAVLSEVPNQPLFFGKREDDLLAHTFAEYLETGDEEWPLLFPMTKSAVAAMDALEKRGIAKRFVVTGASKRGWTSWLAGVVDERVAGIVPVVFDNLGFAAQMRHQEEVWGAYSDELRDYTLRGLQSQMGTPRGAKLVAMVDPLAHRTKLGRPRKLVVNGTNDPYWTADAIRFYWDELEGEKSVVYVPNGGHGIAHDERVVAATAAFARRIADARPMPKLAAETKLDGARLDVTLRSDEAPRAARLWVARAPRADFRDAEFSPVEATARDGAFAASIDLAESGAIAVVGEADYGDGDSGFPLSTPLRVFERSGS